MSERFAADSFSNVYAVYACINALGLSFSLIPKVRLEKAQH